MSARRQRIVLIAPPWYPVPPHGYGGTELVVALLARELRSRGHDVFVFAAQGSPLATHTVAEAHWASALGTPQEHLRDLTYAWWVIDRIRALSPVDTIHDHTGGAALLALALDPPAPIVHTVHGLLDEPTRTFLASLGRKVALTAISEAQRRAAPELRWLATVHNAVDVDALQVGPAPDGGAPYLLSLARICPVKGQHTAIEVSRRAGVRLVLAGKVEATPEGRAYYEHEIRPHVDGRRVIHLHNVAGAEKARLLAGATALVAPLHWEEPFGLYMAEAMASGTPVIAFPRGAAPELIDDGVTGRLVESTEEMVRAVGTVAAIDRVRCASLARARFHPRRMADDYLGAYAVNSAPSRVAISTSGLVQRAAPPPGMRGLRRTGEATAAAGSSPN